jgi:protein-tyrosine phosphatase
VDETGPLSQLYNFRELVGLATDCGGRLRPGVLFRSDSWHEATREDIDYLTGKLGIRTIVDLRAAREADADGNSPLIPDFVRYYHFPMAGGPGGAIEGAPSGQRLATRYIEYLAECAESVVSAVRVVAGDDSGPTVVHCRAGKDRTGTVIAVILGAVGVSPQHIAEDYALTTIGMKKIMARLRASPTYQANVRRLPEEMYSSDASTMKLFLELLDAQSGGAARWLVDHGLAEAELRQLKSRLIDAGAVSPGA